MAAVAGVQEEEGKVVGVRNIYGRAGDSAEIGVGRSRKEEDAGVVAAAAYGRGGFEGSNRWGKEHFFPNFLPV